MDTHHHLTPALRAQSSIVMLRQSLKQVFPARDDCVFGDLLRRFDQEPGAHR